VSKLTLIRHGQAKSFQRENALTALGEAQAARLACYWLRHDVEFDEVVTGTLARQVRTGEVVADAYRAAGRPWPEARRDAGWNEYDATGVLGHADERLASWKAGYEGARGTPEENRYFQRMLEAAMLLWMDGEMTSEHIEPWPAFRERVSGAIGRVMAGPPGRRVAVFTSGGPIGFTVQVAAKAPPRTFLDVNWRVRNLSVSEFLFDRDRLTLDSFNSIGHLEERELWSYR
jgi:broad specificity phosphatase PhoE